MRIATIAAIAVAIVTGQACAEDTQQWQALQDAVTKAGGSIDEKVSVVSPSPRLAIRGMQAGRAYQTGEVITSTPHTMLMSNHTAYLSEKDDTGFGVALREMRSDTFTDLDALVFHVMNEKQKGADSKWAEYLRYMPSSLPQPMFWDEEQMRERFTANKDAFARIYGDENSFVRDMQKERQVLNANYRAHSELLNVTLQKEKVGKGKKKWGGPLRRRAVQLGPRDDSLSLVEPTDPVLHDVSGRGPV